MSDAERTPGAAPAPGTTTGATAVRRRRRRPHWSIGLVLAVLVVAGAGYQYFSSGPAQERVGDCVIVPNAGPGHVSDCSRMDLSGEDLAGVDLRMAHLEGVDLRDADLTGAILYGADLRNADLRGTDFTEADLTSSDLTGSTLGGTDFTKTGIAGMNVNETLLATDNRSVWNDTGKPSLLTLGSEVQRGIVTNSCRNREGLYYPGVAQVSCTLTTASEYDGSLSYGRTVEVKQSPTIDAPSELTFAEGDTVRATMRADSPWPVVQTSFTGELPDGVRWDPGSQRLVGEPARGSAGTYDVTFVAENGHRVTQDVTIVVTRS